MRERREDCQQHIITTIIIIEVRDSSVCITLRDGRFGDRTPVRGGARFSALLKTGPGAHPASRTTGTGPFPGVKRPGRGIDPEVKEKVNLFIYFPYGPSWPVLG